jgi:hypothetical protein
MCYCMVLYRPCHIFVCHANLIQVHFQNHHFLHLIRWINKKIFLLKMTWLDHLAQISKARVISVPLFQWLDSLEEKIINCHETMPTEKWHLLRISADMVVQVQVCEL